MFSIAFVIELDHSFIELPCATVEPPGILPASDEQVLFAVAAAFEYQEIGGDFRRLRVRRFYYLNVSYQVTHA
jgi:hypothetical protein